MRIENQCCLSNRFNGALLSSTIYSDRKMTLLSCYENGTTSENTRKAYRSDIKHYKQSGGVLPAAPHSLKNVLHQLVAMTNE